jgi:hypothetical protein
VKSHNKRANNSAIAQIINAIQLWIMMITMIDLDTVLTLNSFHSISQMC